jgi:hypothetical protein
MSGFFLGMYLLVVGEFVLYSSCITSANPSVFGLQLHGLAWFILGIGVSVAGLGFGWELSGRGRGEPPKETCRAVDV